MPLQGQALKTVARPQADEHPLDFGDVRLPSTWQKFYGVVKI